MNHEQIRKVIEQLLPELMPPTMPLDDIRHLIFAEDVVPSALL